MKIDFSPPFIDEDIKNEVISALESGWITTGPKVKALELETAAYVGIEHALCINSATSGLMLVLHWLGIGRGDEVIARGVFAPAVRKPAPAGRADPRGLILVPLSLGGRGEPSKDSECGIEE